MFSTAAETVATGRESPSRTGAVESISAIRACSKIFGSVRPTINRLIEAPKSGGGRYRFFAPTIEDAGEIIERWGGAAALDSGEVTLYKDVRRDNAYHSVTYLGGGLGDERVMVL